MIIIFVLVLTLITLYAIITPVYLPSFLHGKSLILGDVRAKNTFVDAITYRNAYTVSIFPTLRSDFSPPLDNAPISTGGWTTGLEGYPGTFTLRDTKQDTVALQVKPPKGWKPNTPVSVRFHFTPSNDTAGELDLRLWYNIAAVSQAFTTTYSNTRINKSIVLNSSNTHLTALFPDISLVGETEQTLILFALERQANGGDSTDTYVGDIYCLKIEVMFQINKPGLPV